MAPHCVASLGAFAHGARKLPTEYPSLTPSRSRQPHPFLVQPGLDVARVVLERRGGDDEEDEEDDEEGAEEDEEGRGGAPCSHWARGRCDV